MCMSCAAVRGCAVVVVGGGGGWGDKKKDARAHSPLLECIPLWSLYRYTGCSLPVSGLYLTGSLVSCVCIPVLIYIC